MKKLFFSLMALVTFHTFTIAQNTFPVTGAAGIGTTTPNAASLLDITSTTKGVLIPRMTKAQRDAIVAPVEGLMIYQTNSTPGFYFYDGNSWESVAPKGANKTLSNLSAPTALNAELLPQADNTFNLGSASFAWKDLFADGNAYFGNGMHIGGTSTPAAKLEITPTKTTPAAIRVNPYEAGTSSGTGLVQLLETSSNGVNYVGFRAPSAITADKIWTLPAADGTNGQVLSTNGAGVLSWVTGTGGGAETDPQVGTNTTSFIPRWDGTALSTGSIFDDGDQVGIGTASPSAYLHINGDGNADLPHLQIRDLDADGYARIYLSSFTGEIGDNRKWKILGRTSLTEENNDFLIQQVSKVNGTEFGSTRLSILHNGDMGIGTSVPLARLHVVSGLNDKFRVGSEAGTPAFIVDNLGKVGVNVLDPNSTFHINAPTGEDAMRVQINGSTRFFVNSNGGVSVGGSSTPPSNGLYVNGNAGIGTSSPQTKLHINGIDEVLRLDGTNPYMRFYSAAAEKSYIQQTGDDFRLGTVGANTNGKVQITAGSATAMTIRSSGNIGIGTTSPSSLLHLKGNSEVLRIDGTAPFIQFYNGTAVKSFIWSTGNDLKIGTSTGNATGKVIFGTAGGGDAVFLDSDGTVGIGTNDTKGYKLGVAGNIVCEELKVKLAGNWPDYVFTDEYKLPSLSEVENSILVNKHLPGIPSAKEIHEEGINVGDMQKLMMQKIEELTLYVIDLQKQNDDLKSEVTSLRSAIK